MDTKKSTKKGVRFAGYSKIKVCVFNGLESAKTLAFSPSWVTSCECVF